MTHDPICVENTSTTGCTCQIIPDAWCIHDFCVCDIISKTREDERYRAISHEYRRRR